jgi:hypothetical protein
VSRAALSLTQRLSSVATLVPRFASERRKVCIGREYDDYSTNPFTRITLHSQGLHSRWLLSQGFPCQNWFGTSRLELPKRCHEVVISAFTLSSHNSHPTMLVSLTSCYKCYCVTILIPPFSFCFRPSLTDSQSPPIQ